MLGSLLLKTVSLALMKDEEVDVVMSSRLWLEVCLKSNVALLVAEDKSLGSANFWNRARA